MVEYVNYESPKEPKLYKFGKFSFSNIEIKHLSFALFMIILTIFAFQNKRAIFNLSILFSLNTLYIFGLYALTIGLGFLLHELGHKFVAQHYGYISEFRADFNMLFLMFILALFSPLIFLAPGAVMIMGRVTKKQNGIISVAGPLVNLTLASIFMIIGFFFNPISGSMFELVITLGIKINAFLGVFNMLPIWVLDGKKVFAWNKYIYFLVMILLLFFLFFSF